MLSSILLHNNQLSYLDVKPMLFGEKTLSKRRFSLYIPEELAEWLEREAAHQGRTRNNLINRILEQYLRHVKKTAK